MAGDVLQITVFQVQDFNREAQVDAAGNIVLPLIGGVPAAGKTVHEVESEIAQRLRAKYLQNPQVLVTIKDAVGLRVSVEGAVKTPGVIQLRGDTTLTHVIAQAQGFTDTADKSSVSDHPQHRSRTRRGQSGCRRYPRRLGAGSAGSWRRYDCG